MEGPDRVRPDLAADVEKMSPGLNTVEQSPTSDHDMGIDEADGIKAAVDQDVASQEAHVKREETPLSEALPIGSNASLYSDSGPSSMQKSLPEPEGSTSGPLEVKQEPEDSGEGIEEALPAEPVLQEDPSLAIRKDGPKEYGSDDVDGPSARDEEDEVKRFDRLNRSLAQVQYRVRELERQQMTGGLPQVEMASLEKKRKKIAKLETELGIGHPAKHRGNADDDGAALRIAPSKRKRKATGKTTARKKRSKTGRGKNDEVATERQDMATEYACNLLTIQEPMRLTSRLGEMAEPQLITSKTIKDQLKKIRKQYSKYRDIDDDQMAADNRALSQSRATFKNKLVACDGKWLVKGMQESLHHYQLFGASWMIQKERKRIPPQGGILADGMGLGKTIEVLACIVGNPPSEAEKSRGRSTTLIVVPANLMNQWKEEVQKHCGDTLGVLTYRHIYRKELGTAVLSNSPIV